MDERLFLTKKRFFVISAFVGILIFVAYAAINFYIGDHHDYYDAVFELFLALCLAISLPLLRSEKTQGVALGVGSFVLLAISLHNYASGGFDQTGLLWVYMSPLLLFFVQGFRKGVIWNLVLFGLLGISMFINIPGHYETPYTLLTIVTFFISLAVISILTGAHQLAQEKYLQRIERQGRELAKVNSTLNREIGKREDAIGDLEEKKQELEKFNKLMTGREMKMITLKKELKVLKERAGYV